MNKIIARIWHHLPSGLRWRINCRLHPDEVALFQLLRQINHDEGLWPVGIPQLSHFDADQNIIEVAFADWPDATEVYLPEATKWSTLYVDWPDGQTILIADSDGKVSRLMTDDVMGTFTMEIGIRDGNYVDLLGHFVSVRHGSAEE